ncbi:MAG TPA: 1-acyl-sn-glycerol-3-phosphate acyltransferase [Polyangiaceae bacterium]|nr:1-acyl-sn-glycerol-3-phosphate acyltransferase [Polyangiaceae bacterium]
MTPNGSQAHKARELTRLSALEMVAALGCGDAPALVRRGLALPFWAASRRLGETLALLDGSLESQGLPAAAEQALTRCGVALQLSGSRIPGGACVILANHPGAYDALALMWAIGRQDLLILAADRRFLRALTGLSAAHLGFVGERPGERAAALKRCLRWLRRGGAVLHFPAGAIEPDADFASTSSPLLGSWQPGVPALVKACARASGRVLLAGVRGVHSPRAKRLLLTRLAERRGITTLSPLLQLVRGLRDVKASIGLVEATPAAELGLLDDQELVERLRGALLNAILTA